MEDNMNESDVPFTVNANPATNIFFVSASTATSSPQVHRGVFQLNPVPAPRQNSYQVTMDEVPDEDGSVRHLGRKPTKPIPDLPLSPFSYQANQDGHLRQAPTQVVALEALADLKILLQGAS